MLKEFKEFAMKGNIVDLAVAVIIGGAFGKIITALTDSLIMPIIALLMGKGGMSDVSFTIGSSGFPCWYFYPGNYRFYFDRYRLVPGH